MPGIYAANVIEIYFCGVVIKIEEINYVFVKLKINIDLFIAALSSNYF